MSWFKKIFTHPATRAENPIATPARHTPTPPSDVRVKIVLAGGRLTASRSSYMDRVWSVVDSSEGHYIFTGRYREVMELENLVTSGMGRSAEWSCGEITTSGLRPDHSRYEYRNWTVTHPDGFIRVVSNEEVGQAVIRTLNRWSMVVPDDCVHDGEM